jgi:ATP-dependent RNA helicase DDX24/MAK5
LRDLSQIRFLVLDEADRMVQEHCFPEMLQILEAVHTANPGDEDDDEEEEDSEDDEIDGDFLSGLPGVKGEAKVIMLTDEILQHLQSQKAEAPVKPTEVQEVEFEEEDDDEEEEEHFEKLDFPPQHKPVHRQTFIYSATLTLPHTSTKSKPAKRRRKHKELGLDGAIADILARTHAMGETKVVDLSSSASNSTTVQSKDARQSVGVRLPPGLRLERIKCTQRHKDSHLYAYLVTTAQGASGPCLVFCNSVAAVRRVGTTLQTLGLPVRLLHAHMQQVSHILMGFCFEMLALTKKLVSLNISAVKKTDRSRVGNLCVNNL